MKTKCEGCHTSILKKDIHRCNGLMCTKFYCQSCYHYLSLCYTCHNQILCPICILVWDVCPSCLDNDNAVIN
ncbi:hypothetical protein IIV30_167L [Invertebrate iridescent virus 30]|uniref:Uncharacterized protein n=1 Tax=Invertebrate iridescent virus 30 TaxID=345585 RepID=W8W1U8_9VIRU|nr:hypothetical protein IIV30_167L [Invertebrate iridescent virus 30]CCV02362.1 hypothetical protein IIV30_167L [Invertebrate iridescent virus 30]